ncbi:MAG TPA: hypothetical protein DEP35_04080 [Deltaproteobacteria bacterium]|nr:hypothetical protein [Deltaproteobacteria bacterium]
MGEGEGCARVGSVALREGAGDAAASACAHSSRVGADFSSAQDSRWRITGTCASQHETLQNTSPVRGRLQVDTLQIQ